MTNEERGGADDAAGGTNDTAARASEAGRGTRRSRRAAREPSRAQQMRHLLPRWPPDWVVGALLAIGLVAYFLAGPEEDSNLWFLAPGAAAAVIQKVNGHWAAWHSEGVERTYVLESAAMCFYLLCAFLLGAGILQGLGVVHDVNLAWGALVALFLDSTVRDWAKNRYV